MDPDAQVQRTEQTFIEQSKNSNSAGKRCPKDDLEGQDMFGFFIIISQFSG